MPWQVKRTETVTCPCGRPAKQSWVGHGKTKLEVERLAEEFQEAGARWAAGKPLCRRCQRSS